MKPSANSRGDVRLPVVRCPAGARRGRPAGRAAFLLYLPGIFCIYYNALHVVFMFVHMYVCLYIYVYMSALSTLSFFTSLWDDSMERVEMEGRRNLVSWNSLECRKTAGTLCNSFKLWKVRCLICLLKKHYDNKIRKSYYRIYLVLTTEITIMIIYNNLGLRDPWSKRLMTG